jgi:N-methylhydantoinase A/oxoprolinase/acetone carboxylase beta subunit
VVEGLASLLEREEIPAERVHGVVSGATTVVTNLIIERKGAPTGLLATAGFPDLIEIAREVRCDIYDLRMPLPVPLVPRKWRKEVVERVDRNGAILTPLDERSVRRAVRDLRRDGVKAVAVSFLHAYRHPEHERRVREIIHEVAPDLYVSLSSEVLPEIREYERTVATVLNAYVQPLIGPYLEELEHSLAGLGVCARLHIMQSNGGVIARDFAQAQPLRMLESGPAAGALAAAHVAGLAGLARKIHELGETEGLRRGRKRLPHQLSYVREAFTCQTISHDTLLSSRTCSVSRSWRALTSPIRVLTAARCCSRGAMSAWGSPKRSPVACTTHVSSRRSSTVFTI